MRLSQRVVIVSAVIVLGASTLTSSVAFAQVPSAAERDNARSLMDDGDKKRDQGDIKGALKSYEAADAIMKVPSTGIEVARAQLSLGLLIEARDTLTRVARIPAKPGEPPPFTAARKSAEALLTEVTPKIPSIQIATNAEPGETPQISVDGEAIPPAAATAPRKVNPGNHTIVVRLGAIERKQEVAVLERESKIVNIDLKEPTQASAARPASEATASTSDGSAPQILMYGGFALAAVGLTVGAVTGILSISKTSSLKDTCLNNACPADKQGDIDSATSLGDISTGAFVVAGVGLGVSIVGLVMSSHGKSQAPASTAHARPILGPTYAGVAGTF